MPIDNRAGSWASKHMSPIFQTTTTEMSSDSVGKVLREHQEGEITIYY